MADREGNRTRELSRELGLVTAIACGVGSVIGSGIFKKPGLMATQLGSPELLILIWVVAGIITLFGALSIAEISGMFRDPGGQYVYFNKGFNPFVGYLYGWATFVVIQSGSIASIAYVFADSLGYFIPLPRLPAAWEQWSIPVLGIGVLTPFKSIGLKLATIGLIAFLTTINYLGVKFGSLLTVVFSALKVAVIAAIVVLAFAFGHGSFGHLTQSAGAGASLPGSPPVFLAIIMALAGAFWAYDGWINVTYMSGEIKNVQRNLPRSMAIATLIIIAIYVSINVAYIYIIPVGQMAANYRAGQESGAGDIVAVDVAGSFLGRYGGAAIAVAIMISTFGAVNGTTMMSARIYFAMARERLFFRRLAEVHPRFHTPGNSLLAQGAWSSILVLSGTFDQLTDMLIFVTWIFYALAAVGVFTLRRRMPDVPRPYKVWGYPLTPLIFIAFASIYVLFTLYSDILNYRNGSSPLINSLMGLVWVAIGIPGYLWWSHGRRQQAPRTIVSPDLS